MIFGQLLCQYNAEHRYQYNTGDKVFPQNKKIPVKITVDKQYYMSYSMCRNNIIQHIILHESIILYLTKMRHRERPGKGMKRKRYEICKKKERSILHGF